ncbi:LysM peptidoglycan-binding domain-containing protein [Neolewinella agarilytica]|uniref:LysM peptidoglycan-binding domain-containing protein n=1 Tax=Neolewinella agarilytica TaxID=478744 RepID=UPI002357E79B|nr:LysM peptidoglycan-binding domain-containing protein [Neolewinella agarilytica]
MKFLTSFVAALLVATASLQAEQIFVLFDGSCGDRVLYEQAIATQPRMEYYAYHFPLAGGDRLILETGAEGATVQSYLPQGYVYCNDPRLSLDLADRVNAGVDRVFILLPTANNQYLIQPVVMGAVFQRRGNNFSYNSPLTGFQFDTENGIIGENLAYNNPGAKVYFEGRETSPCKGYFLFRQLKPNSSYPVIDYRISPEIGVFERRLGSDGVSTTGGVILAKQVNGLPVANYLSNVCANANAVASATPAPAAYGTQPVYTPPNIQAPIVRQPESSGYGGQSSSTTPVTNSVVHTVVKGETLYAISRKYGTTPDAIRANNGLTSNDLFPGQQLAVSTTTAQAAVAQNQPTVPVYGGGQVANANTGSAQPTPYGTVAQPQAYGQDQTSRGGQAVYGEDLHTVQPGETVASIALKYGYTSAKFREINDLGANTVPRVGERLKTSDCNCPAPTAAASLAAPAAYGQQAPATPQPYGQTAAPQAYGQQPATPQAYGQPAPQVQQQQTGTPVGTTTPTYRAPQGYQQPATQAPSTQINNNPNFGQVVPDANVPSSSSMGTLESRGPSTAAPATNPSTYGSYPAPQQTTTAPAYAPSTYSTPAATPNAYGTPVGANVNYSAPATAPSNRAFHLVQEGESLYSISRRYGITTDEIRRLNNLKTTDVIVPFQKLYVN